MSAQGCEAEARLGAQLASHGGQKSQERAEFVSEAQARLRWDLSCMGEATGVRGRTGFVRVPCSGKVWGVIAGHSPAPCPGENMWG